MSEICDMLLFSDIDIVSHSIEPTAVTSDEELREGGEVAPTTTTRPFGNAPRIVRLRNVFGRVKRYENAVGGEAGEPRLLPPLLNNGPAI